MTPAEHIATIFGTVLVARALADMFVFLAKRHKEKKDEKERMEFKIEHLRDRINKLEKDIYVLNNSQKEER